MREGIPQGKSSSEKGGVMLKKIGSAARFEIERMMEQQINLKLWVKVRRDWRDSDTFLKNYGYREEP